MYKALIIGCGNIGALYDWDSNKILTHARAIHLNDHFTLTVYDLDETLANKVAEKYNCAVIRHIDQNALRSFDCVSICTPTNTHYEFLLSALQAQVKLIICEKPVSNKLSELNDLQTMYGTGMSKVLINYFRRFQPAYAAVKQNILQILKEESLTNISIRYQRGFLNNCGHAFDTIEFLIDNVLDFNNIQINNRIFDSFPDDPTLSLQAISNNTNVSITGLSKVQFAFFEIDLYFEYHWVAIKNAGALIEIYKAGKDKRRFQPLQIQDHLTRKDCMNNYMKYVITYAHDLLNSREKQDNFIGSVNMNMRMLNYIG